jgi:hypothetical protein
MEMIAAYRAERLSQRPLLRAGLRLSHANLRHSRDGTDQSDEPTPEQGHPPQPASASAPATPATGSHASVFANLVSLEGAVRLGEAARTAAAAEPADEPIADRPDAISADLPRADPVPAHSTPADPTPADPTPADPTPADPTPNVPPTGHAAPCEPAATEPRAPFDPPLAEIGFGPGMLIRLSQLGLHTTGELAQANAAQLRSELGDISRLIDVETWIAAARQRTQGEA